MAAPRNHTVQKTLSENSERLSGEIRAAQEAAAEAGCAAAAEGLNIAVRRIRHGSTVSEIGATLLETAAEWCGRVALLVHKGDSLTGWRAQGFAQGFAERWSGLQVPIHSAPALAQALQTQEAVVSLNLADHLSGALVEALELGAEEKVYLFPLCLRGKVVAVVCADGLGAEGGVHPAALELLCGVAETAIEAVSSRPSARELAGEQDRSLSESARAAASPGPPPVSDWNQMPPADRDMHLRAQRFARVLVADLQLYRAVEIREGKKARDIYGRLREEIDKSREAYYRKFGQTAAGGVDYLHVEMVRSLAEEQPELMGPGYPGPAVEAAVG